MTRERSSTFIRTKSRRSRAILAGELSRQKSFIWKRSNDQLPIAVHVEMGADAQCIWYDDSEHIAPGRTDGKGSVDETDVRVGLREVALLGIRGRDEMLGEQSDMICSDQHTI
jgi:hypothetical protein